MTTHETAARLVKAKKLLTAVDALECSPSWAAGQVEPEDLDALTEENWAGLAELAGTHLPSDDTRATLRSLVEARNDARRREFTDPFEGLS